MSKYQRELLIVHRLTMLVMLSGTAGAILAGVGLVWLLLKLLV